MQLDKCGLYLIWNDDKRTKQSTSAGAFILIADAFLHYFAESEVYGVVWNTDNAAIYSVARCYDDLTKMQGSKYVQSSMGDTLKNINNSLKNGRTVLFCGTGCQIMALKNYIGIESENLYTIEVLCHGVPSPKLWKEYLVYLEKKYGGKPYDIRFRNKTKCNRLGYVFSFKANGKKHLIYPDEDLYYSSFLNNNSLRPSCYKCPFIGTKSCGDILLGDSNNQSFHPDDTISLMSINTNKGIFLYRLISSCCEICETNISDESTHNQKLVRPALVPYDRNSFYAEVFEKGISNCVFESNLITKIKNRIKFRISTKRKNVIKKITKRK